MRWVSRIAEVDGKLVVVLPEDDQAVCLAQPRAWKPNDLLGMLAYWLTSGLGQPGSDHWWRKIDIEADSKAVAPQENDEYGQDGKNTLAD